MFRQAEDTYGSSGPTGVLGWHIAALTGEPGFYVRTLQDTPYRV